ncbi:hypothetical protein CPB97_005909, partial [Podila verticillata]
GAQGDHGDVKGMGLSINTLPFRADMDDHGVLDCVHQVHSRLAALVEHENASLALAQHCGSVPAGSPLFGALLNYRHTIAPSTDSVDIEFVSKEERVNYAGIELLSGRERTNYPFTLSVEDFGTALGLTALILEPVDPVRTCGYIEQALTSLAYALEHTPNMPAQGLEILPMEERDLLLRSWNTTDVPYPDQLCIHQLFEEQAARTTDAVAIVYEDQALTYAELNARANRLAHQLINLGVKPDTLVALCVERSPAIVVGILAILKAGGAYLPLDPAYASERL